MFGRGVFGRGGVGGSGREMIFLFFGGFWVFGFFVFEADYNNPLQPPYLKNLRP